MKKALILLNMGGPNSIEEVDLFLKNMFADEHILPIKNSFLRNVVAKLIIAKRKGTAKNNYEKIGGKSPINAITARLVSKLQNLQNEYYVDYAMRYVPPYAEETAARLKEQKIEEVVLFSMYPHYSKTTTLSSIEDFRKACEAISYTPLFREVERYPKDRLYNLAVFERIKEALGNRDPKDFSLIISAHGLPQKVIDAGDSYQQEVMENVEVLKKLLEIEGLVFEGVEIAYQSKVGPMKWTEPSLETVLENHRDKNVLVYPLSFTIDNSETLYELHREYQEIASMLGIKEFIVSACLNDSPLFAETILKLSYEAKEVRGN